MCACSVTQSCPTLHDPMTSLPGFCPWDFPGKNTGVGLAFPTPGDLPDPEVELASPATPALAGRFFTALPPGKPNAAAAAAAAKSHQSCPTLYNIPWMAAQQAPLPLGFSIQEHWSGLPFSSPMYESEK